MRLRKRIKNLEDSVDAFEDVINNIYELIKRIETSIKYHKGQVIHDMVVLDFYEGKYTLINKEGKKIDLFEFEIDNILKIN
jgi:hypothetical protein